MTPHRVSLLSSAVPRRCAAWVAIAALQWASVAVAADAIDLGALLGRIQGAAQHENYAGTFVHQQGNVVMSSRIAHMADRTGEHEKLEILNGQAREFVRNNDDVQCFVPDDKVVFVEKRAKYDSFPALLTSVPVAVERYYRAIAEGTERIAGRTASIVRLVPSDALRYGYRLWFDRELHLLLKAQTLGEKDVVIEQLAFTDLILGGVDRARIKPSFGDTASWRVETNRTVPVDLGRAGWSVSAPVPGFQKVMEVRRAFGDRDGVAQMVFSDGLAAVSIFIEAQAPPRAAEGSGSKGPIHVATRRHGNHWLTVVGDVPGETVNRMAAAVAYSAPR